MPLQNLDVFFHAFPKERVLSSFIGFMKAKVTHVGDECNSSKTLCFKAKFFYQKNAPFILQGILLPCITFRRVGIFLKPLDELNHKCHFPTILDGFSSQFGTGKDKEKEGSFLLIFP
jgi:hypothetical protein